MRRLFRQFSFPGGIPSHAAPETPGSINEGGELGYSLSHAYGAAFDNPDLIVACVIGDGEAETGPLATSWHGNKFLNPATDGAVLPILHLNGYKIANPTILARIPREELESLFRRLWLQAAFRRGRRPGDDASADGGDPRPGARRDRARSRRRRAPASDIVRPHWPMIVLRSPKGWTGPKDGRRPEDRGLSGAPTRCRSPTWRQARARQAARRLDAELPAAGTVRRRRRAAARDRGAGARGRPAHERQPARQWRAAAARAAICRISPITRSRSTRPGRADGEATRGHGRLPARRHAKQQPRNFRLFGPDETASNRLSAVFEVTDRAWDRRDPALGRSSGARRAGHGDPERAYLPGLARRLSADRAARPVLLLRSLHPHRRFDVQPARQMAEGRARDPVAAADRLAQLSADLACLAPGPQRLQPSGPGLHRLCLQQKGRHRPGLSAARRQLPCSTSPTIACAAGTAST